MDLTLEGRKGTKPDNRGVLAFVSFFFGKKTGGGVRGPGGEPEPLVEGGSPLGAWEDWRLPLLLLPSAAVAAAASQSHVSRVSVRGPGGEPEPTYGRGSSPVRCKTGGRRCFCCPDGAVVAAAASQPPHGSPLTHRVFRRVPANTPRK